MTPLPSLIFYTLLLCLCFFSISSKANITSLKFYIDQVYDVQRSPAFPMANTIFLLSGFRLPLRQDATAYQLNPGEYVQLVFVGGVCKNGEVGINRYNASGEWLETVQITGHIYGLSSVGFLHENGNNIGTFLAKRPITDSDQVSYIPKTGPNPETCETLEKYK